MCVKFLGQPVAHSFQATQNTRVLKFANRISSLSSHILKESSIYSLQQAAYSLLNEQVKECFSYICLLPS